ncbi:MAG: hypothetical protein ACRD10_00330, partial [Terriglobia bacterium]
STGTRRTMFRIHGNAVNLLGRMGGSVYLRGCFCTNLLVEFDLRIITGGCQKLYRQRPQKLD